MAPTLPPKATSAATVEALARVQVADKRYPDAFFAVGAQLICQLNGSTDLVLQQALMQCVAACLQWLPVPVPLGARIGRDGLLAAR